MMRARWIALLGMAVVPAVGCAQRPETTPVPSGSTTSAPAGGTSANGTTAAGTTAAPIRGATDTIPGTNWTQADWRVLQEKTRWALEQGLDRLPIGEGVAKLGASFVGATYTPATLEAPGPEHLVINLREFDCVTFIENMLAMTYLIRNDRAVLQQPAQARAKYEEYLRTIRYRGGKLDGYPSRLHYFSEWLTDGETKGLLKVRTRELGGVPDPEQITFMGTHRDAYKQLVDDKFYQDILLMERRLNASGPRYFIPEAQVAGIASGIKNGDVIAITSTVAGLDIVHTGIAIWQGDKLHLMHAPLVGKSVEISVLPLAERLLGFASQDGIMVATPQDWKPR
jgi:hypothetical protein